MLTIEQSERILTLRAAITEMEAIQAAWMAAHRAPGGRPFTPGDGWDTAVSCEVYRGMSRGLDAMREEIALIGV